MQKDLNHHPEFEVWYAPKKDALARNTTARFVLESRNVILKEGPITIPKETLLSLEEGITLSDTVEVKVVRGNPWYRRSPGILWDDFCADVLRPLKARLRKFVPIRQSQQNRTSVQSATIVDRYYFDADDLRHVAAFEVLDEYFALLDEILKDWENLKVAKP